MTNFENEAFQPCKEWIARKIDSGSTWDEITAYGKDASNLEELKDEELFPLYLTPEMWVEFVEYYKSIVITVQIVDGEDVVAIDKGGLSNSFSIPSEYSSTWERYKNLLGNKMSPESIANLQKSCLWILNHLSTDTRISGEVKGLVTGSVQSGKTANMEGLISMAADYDWNFFIILSGTIDNLRKQTRDRFKDDLCNSEGILWRVLDFTSDDKKTTADELKLNSLSGSKNFSNRYLTVCLKNRRRLEKLIDVDEIWNASSAIDDIISHYKGESILFKKYHETGHMLTVAYQPNHRYRKDWRLLMKESVDSWFATINFFDTHLKNL